MPDKKEKDTSFEAEINRLGLLAVDALGTDEYMSAYRRLIEYFQKNYINIILKKCKLSNAYKVYYGEMTVSEDLQEKYDKCFEEINEEFLAVIDRLNEILHEKIRSFDFQKRKSDTNPFFAYLFKDLYYVQKNAANDLKNQGKALDTRERYLLKSILDAFDALEVSYRSQKMISVVSKKTNISEKRIKEILIKYGYNTFSLDESFETNDGDDNPGGYYEIVTGHESAEEEFFENSVESKAEIKQTNLLNGLLLLNKLIRENFNEKQKAVFSKGFTNEEIIIEGVKRYQKPPKNFEQTVAENWDKLCIEGIYNRYANGEYLCIDGYVLKWFERVRRQILSKEIAEYLGMTPSNYTKVYEKACELVYTKTEGRLKYGKQKRSN